MDIYKKLQEQGEQLESILNILNSTSSQKKTDDWLDIKGIIEYLPYPMSKPTIYEKLQSGKLPGEKRGKYWFSKKSWIDQFLETGDPLVFRKKMIGRKQ
jgi:hypothetical protein